MPTCAACGTDNPAGHRFCGACGAALAVTCPSCGTPATPGFRFCGACGSSLAPADATGVAPTVAGSPTTERRVCSVLFADLVGFTPLSETRDPEEVRELLSRYFDAARTVIGRYGGTVEKFIGDAVMAVWGTPVVLEGDADRAVRAGMDLVAAVAALGSEVGADGLAARAGVVTGEVAVTLGAVGEGMVAGDAVNTAARVQAAAEPGAVLVDSPTQRLAGAVIGFVDAGQHRLKGKSEPVGLWRATRVLSNSGGARRVDGLETAMVGRDAEDRTLRELFHACADRRISRVVTVTGTAGIGKSRLGWEFEKYIDGLADAAFWHRGRCLSYGEGVAYWALAEALRQRFGIAEEDPADAAAQKFLIGLERFVPDSDQRSFIGVRVGRLLGITHPDDVGADLGAAELFSGWRLFLERLADVDPVILLIEDAQHADDNLLDFVEHVVDWARHAPVYVVLFARPEMLERRPGLSGGRNRTSLTIDALDEGSMRTLVGSLVPNMPEAAVAAIVGQAEGNPLFAVETIRSLIDRDVIVAAGGDYHLVADVGELSVPDTLRGLLAARLDTLDPAVRELVAGAAVLGTSFPADALARISGRPPDEVTARLAELVRRGVFEVSADPLSPERGAYVFSQNMLRQVAYDTLSRRDRRARHLAVAEHLRAAFTGGGDEIMDVVAQHYLDALDAIPDDDDAEIRAEALASLTRAADRSERAGARLRAGRSLRRAAELAAEGGAPPGPLWERAAAQFGAATRFDDAIAACLEARRSFLADGEQRAGARVMAAEGRWRRRAGRVSEATPLLDEALEVLRADADLDTVRAICEAAICASSTGDARTGELADEAMRLGQALDIPVSLMAELLAMRAIVYIADHRITEATAALRHAAELATRSGGHAQLSTALCNLAAVELPFDFAAAAQTGRAACHDGRLAGEQLMIEVGMTNVVTALLCGGEWDVALEEAEQAEREGSARFATAPHAIVRALRGEHETAAELGRLPDLRATEDVEGRAIVRMVDATLAAAAGRPADALELVRDMFFADADLSLESVFLTWPLALRCAFELGDLDAVRELVAGIDQHPIGHVPPIMRSARALARARLAAAEAGEHQALADDSVTWAFAEAVDSLRAAGSPYHLAHGLLDQAEYLGRCGRDPSGPLAESLAINERLRAEDVARRARDLRPSPAGRGMSVVE